MSAGTATLPGAEGRRPHGQPSLGGTAPAAASTPRRVAQVITGLERGGAELMLLRLLGALDRGRFAPEVLSLRPPGVIGARIEQLGIPVHSAEITGALPGPAGLRRCIRALSAMRPDLVHTWMYHADLLGGLVGRLWCRVPVIWALHNSTLDPRQVARTTRAVVRLNGLLSRVLPARIVSCSHTAAAVHRALGFPPRRMIVIPNGFDTASYQPDAAARAAVRAELGLPAQARLLGTFARFHPQKDHRTLCRAAGLAAAAGADLHVLLAGADMDPDNATLAGWIRESGVPERFHLLGERDDMPRLTAALDLAVMSSSFGEAFPLVVGEAMSCAVPCVVTDVGDAALMVGDTGRVVPPGDPRALAGAISALLGLSPGERAGLGAAARSRIERDYALPAVAARYEALYDAVLGAGGP